MRQRFFCLLIAILLTIAPSVFAKSPQRGISVVSDSSTWGKYHALIIGINDYILWPRLQTAVKDATVIRDTLVSQYGFDKENVILRTNKSASRVQISRDLRFLAQSMRKDDNLFIYYAGHGQLDDFTGDGYWVPAEGALKDPSTWVANSYIKAILSSEKLQAKNVVVIADSCYSGSMLRGGPSLMSLDDRRYREKLVEKASLRSRQVISSGGIEPVADGGAEGHSLFAFYLIEALRKNNRDVIDLENLFHTKVWKPVTEIGDQRPNVGRLKTPMDQDGQFVLYNVAIARAQSQVAIKQKTTGKIEREMAAGTAARSAPQNFNAEEEMWAIVKTSSATEDYALFLSEYPNSRFSGAARLKIQQLKRKQNAQLMTASVAPAVVARSHPNNRRAAQNSYKLALFPVKVHSAWGNGTKYQDRAIRTIASMSQGDDRFDFALSYREVNDLSDKVKLFSDIANREDNQVWIKKSVFSSYEPDWEQMKKVGMQIDADIAVLILLRIDSSATIDIYLYDYRQARVYSRTNRVISHNDVPGGIRTNVHQVMREFFKHQ